MMPLSWVTKIQGQITRSSNVKLQLGNSFEIVYMQKSARDSKITTFVQSKSGNKKGFLVHKKVWQQVCDRSLAILAKVCSYSYKYSWTILKPYVSVVEGKKTNEETPYVISIIMLCRQILDLALVLCSVRWILNSRQNFKNFKLELSYRAVLWSNGIRGFSPTKGFHSFDGIHLT